MKQLVVLLGAGASYDCLVSGTDGYDPHRPPLAKQLFDYERFGNILDRYPRAQMATADIAHALRSGTMGLEEYLTELRDSTDEYSQQRWREIPLYLQHLLFHIGLPGDRARAGGYTNRPGNYDRLLSATLKVDEVTFITLNYDTLFDDRLRPYQSPVSTESLDWYVVPERNWALIKLHGSVNWGRRVLNHSPPSPIEPTGVNVVWELGDTIQVSSEIEHLLPHGHIAAMRWMGQRDGAFYYPALSVPLGAEDSLSCPPDHLDFLEARLAKLDALNLLIIGYSGLDKAVLNLLRDSGKELGQVRIVNGDVELGYAAANNVMAGIGQTFDPAPPVTFGGGFRDFIAGRDLDEFLAAI